MQYNITLREKDNSWQYIISYKNSNGKWRQKSKQGFPFNRKGKQDAKDSALKALGKLKESIGQTIDLNTEYENITFENFTSMFLKHETLYKEGNTLSRYSISVKAFKDLYDLKLINITTLNIQKCIDKLVERKLKTSSIKTYVESIRLIFNYAIKLNILINNPVTNLQLPKDKNNSSKKALTIGELDDLLSKIKNKKYFVISMLAGKCGLRLGEILGLTWDDVYFKTEIISVNKQWKLLKDGKRGFGELKSKNSKREVHMSESVILELKKYMSEYTINKDRRLFNHSCNTSLTSRLLGTYKNIGYDISLHELRHTYATSLVSKGLDFLTVAQLMGHDVKQTTGTYAHVTKDMINNARRIIDEIF